MEEFLFESCEELMKVIFGSKYPPEEGKSYCKESINGKTLQSQVWEVLEDLRKIPPSGERKRRIIILRFGLEDGRKRSLKEIGREFGITEERVRQIIEKALRQLRYSSRSHQFEPYLESEIAKKAVAKRFQKEEEKRKQREEIEKQRRQKFLQPKILSFEERQNEIRTIRALFEKSSFSSVHAACRFINKIIRREILFSDLRESSEEELIITLGMPGSKTELALKEMWQIVNQKS